VLYSILHILARDPDARILMLPADHYVRDESVLAQALSRALDRVEEGKEQPVLLGIEPDEPDTELGYVLPGGPDQAGGQRVARFVEKPTPDVAAELIEQGGLWNAFIIAGVGQTLLNLFLPRYSSIVMEMQVILRRRWSLGVPAGGWPALVDLYTRLPSLDFSRDVLEDKVGNSASCGCHHADGAISVRLVESGRPCNVSMCIVAMRTLRSGPLRSMSISPPSTRSSNASQSSARRRSRRSRRYYKDAGC
jgi:Mannose-1-phosphate guanylyltransferase